MKAAVLNENSKTLTIEDIPTPEPAENELLVKVMACGLCHTDLHYIDHGVRTCKKPPIVLGHEATGVVARDGRNFKEGDRVILPPVFTCGNCKFCNTGRENLCCNMTMLGNTIDGAFAEYVKVPEKDVVALPDEISFEEGCVIADSLSTSYHAVVNRAKVQPQERVIVIGCGGVGTNVVRMAVLQGAEVIACDIDNAKLELAKEMGASMTVNPSEENVQEFLRHSGGSVDVAFEVIGKHQTIETAFKTLGKGGRLCIVGYTNENITINPAKIMFYEQEIIGSVGCPPTDFPKIIELVRDKKVNPSRIISNRFALEDINAALDELRTGKVLRNIIVF